jgi:hypothetical protein
MSEARNLSTADIAAGAANGDERDRPDDGRARTEDELTAPLLPPDEATRYREQWTQVQGRFVDQPRDAVGQADQLVADLMQLLASQFADTRTELERQWNDDGADVSTEDLRVAMTRYRSFFERLLTT